MRLVAQLVAHYLVCSLARNLAHNLPRNLDLSQLPLQIVNEGARKFNYASRFWTIFFNNLRQDETGAAILEEMNSEAKKIGRSGRYVWAKFADKLYSEVKPHVFKNTQTEMYNHACELMEKAFLSKGMAIHYKLELG